MEKLKEITRFSNGNTTWVYVGVMTPDERCKVNCKVCSFFTPLCAILKGLRHYNEIFDDYCSTLKGNENVCIKEEEFIKYNELCDEEKKNKQDQERLIVNDPIFGGETEKGCKNLIRKHILEDINPYNIVVGGVKLDPYKIADLFGLGMAEGQALKKLLRLGRKHKSKREDLQEVISTCERILEMMDEEEN